jgi:hypothetical protein
MIQAARISLLLALFFVTLNVTASSREDEIIAMKVKAHATLHTQLSLNEWCVMQYPATAELSGKVGLYLNPRMEKVQSYLFSPDRNPEFRKFVEAKFKNWIAQGRAQDFANFESKRYTQQMCLNALAHVLEVGIGEKLEAYVEVRK